MAEWRPDDRCRRRARRRVAGSRFERWHDTARVAQSRQIRFRFNAPAARRAAIADQRWRQLHRSFAPAQAQWRIHPAHGIAGRLRSDRNACSRTHRCSRACRGGARARKCRADRRVPAHQQPGGRQQQPAAARYPAPDPVSPPGIDRDRGRFLLRRRAEPARAAFGGLADRLGLQSASRSGDDATPQLYRAGCGAHRDRSD